MAIFVGRLGAFKLARSSDATISGSVSPDDVAVVLNRVGIEVGNGELLTGDLISLSTTDPRGLDFLSPTAWRSGTVEDQVDFYINVNAVGGVRFFDTFEDAINNNRLKEKTVNAFSGDPIEISVSVRDSRYRTLARVQSFQFNTERDALDTTTLHQSSKSTQPGLISASGSLDLLFDYKLLPTESALELPLVMVQTITRLKIGSRFDSLLYIREPQGAESNSDAIFYEFSGIINRAGIESSADAIVRATVDFTVTGEFFLKVGSQSSYILTETEDRLELEQSLDFILQEVDD